MRSAFGVDHGQTVVWKAGPATQDRKTSRTLAGISGASAGLGAAAGGIGYAERKGKDPMGFVHTMQEATGKKISPQGKAKILRTVSRAHGVQAAGAGALALGAGGLAHAYKPKPKAPPKKLSKALQPQTKDRAKKAGAVGVGGAAIGAGGYNAQFLARHGVGHHQQTGRAAHHLIALHNMGEVGLDNKELATAKKTRRIAGKVVGLKGGGALASAGVAAAGGKAIYDATKRPATKKRV